MPGLPWLTKFDGVPKLKSKEIRHRDAAFGSCDWDVVVNYSQVLCSSNTAGG